MGRRRHGGGQSFAQKLAAEGFTEEHLAAATARREALMESFAEDSDDIGSWPKRGVMAPGEGWSGLSATPATFQATSAQAAGLFPHVACEPIAPVGPYFGIDWLAQAGFFVHPIEWVLRNIVKNPNIWIGGEPGFGKSACIKSLILRLLTSVGIRAIIPSDVKGEYDSLLNALGYEPWRLGYGSSMRINPLDAGPLANFDGLDRAAIDERLDEIRVRRIALLVSLLGAKGYVVTQSDEATLTEVLKELTGEATHEGRLATPILPDVWRALAFPSEQLTKARRQESVRDMAESCRPMTDALQSLIDGPLSRLFDGPTTAKVDFNAPIQSLNIRALSSRGDEAIAVALMCLGSWVNSATALLKPGDIIIKPFDEVWRLMRLSTSSVMFLDSDLRLSRDLQTIALLAMHKVGDTSGVGDAGSQASNIADGLLDLCATKVMYAQKARAAEALAERVGLNEIEVGELTGWASAGGRATAETGGRALWRVGDKTYKVSHVLSSHERQMFDTNTRIRRTVDVREGALAGA